MNDYDLVVKSSMIVTPAGPVSGQVAVRDEKIAGILAPDEQASATQDDRRRRQPGHSGPDRHPLPLPRSGLHPQGGLLPRHHRRRGRRRDHGLRHAERRPADHDGGPTQGAPGERAVQGGRRLRAQRLRRRAGEHQGARRGRRHRLQGVDDEGHRARLPAPARHVADQPRDALPGLRGGRRDRSAALHPPPRPRPVRVVRPALTGAVGHGLPLLRPRAARRQRRRAQHRHRHHPRVSAFGGHETARAASVHAQWRSGWSPRPRPKGAMSPPRRTRSRCSSPTTGRTSRRRALTHWASGFPKTTTRRCGTP